jgi:uncharacterized membrane protein YhaH (DUF805 family)
LIEKKGALMGFGEAISAGFGNYVNFSGRAMRSEYWYWTLFVIVGGIVASVIDMAVFGAGAMSGSLGIVSVLFNLAVLLPSIAIGVRRLHDLDRSGWWLLLLFIPLVGAIILIVWFCTRGTPGPNRFGGPPMILAPVMAARM